MRVLVLRALGLGDLLTAVPALRALRRGCPGATIQLAMPAALTDLARLSGAVDEIVDVGPLAALPASVAHADLAVNLHGRGPQSTALLQATAPRRLLAYGVSSTWRADEHEVLRWCRLLVEAGLPADPTDLALPAPPQPPTARGAVLVHPGAAQPSRRWPVDRWAAVVRVLREGDAPVLLSGGPAERDRALRIAARAGLDEVAVLAGRTSPLELAALVAAARLVVSVDTGVAHLATAYGTPSVVLFGPTDPALWGPPADRPQHRVLWAGRTGDNFAPDVDAGLLALSAQEVVAALGEWRRGRGAGAAQDRGMRQERTMGERLYTAEATAEGARTGRAASSDGRLEVQLSRPAAMGGDDGPGTNPEQLFATGYAACFHSAMRHVLRPLDLRPDALADSSVTARVSFDKGGPTTFDLAVELVGHLPALSAEQAQQVMEATHQVCPYSRATRRNIPVTLSVR